MKGKTGMVREIAQLKEANANLTKTLEQQDIMFNQFQEAIKKHERRIRELHDWSDILNQKCTKYEINIVKLDNIIANRNKRIDELIEIIRKFNALNWWQRLLFKNHSDYPQMITAIQKDTAIPIPDLHI